jgi:hypothetical protein
VAKLRKKPKPAAEELEVVNEPAAPPPPVEYKPPLVNEGFIPCPRTPEEIIHNVMVRQLNDDLADPPEPEVENPALALLKKVQDARDAGKPVSVYADEAAKVLQGLEQEEKLTEMVVRYVRIRNIRHQLETDEALNRFFKRVVRRGDLTTREALVFKQMNSAELSKAVKDLLDGLEREAEGFKSDDFARMDVMLQVTEKSVVPFEKTTPQGREIVRKITLRARRQISTAQQPK